jgi:hypothetical protein
MFDPWIGQHYSTVGLNGLRILILGEAHYGEPGEEDPNFTKVIVKKCAQDERFRFFTVTQKIVSGVTGYITDEMRKRFWEYVAFYNFIQEFPGSKPRIRPTDKMWSEAKEPYAQTLDELKPDVVIVLGSGLAGRLPKIENSIAFCYIHHPASCGFNQVSAIIEVKKAYEFATALNKMPKNRQAANSLCPLRVLRATIFHAANCTAVSLTFRKSSLPVPSTGNCFTR